MEWTLAAYNQTDTISLLGQAGAFVHQPLTMKTKFNTRDYTKLYVTSLFASSSFILSQESGHFEFVIGHLDFQGVSFSWVR